MTAPVRVDSRLLTTTITEEYTFDPEKVNEVYAKLGLPDLDWYEDDDRATALFEALYDSQFFNEVFWAGNGPDVGYDFGEFDPEA